MAKTKRTNRSSVPARRTEPAVATAPSSDQLLGDIRTLIEAVRQQVARAVNSTMVTLYWHVGKRIREEVLGGQRAEYGEQIVSSLSAQLTAEYGRGFDRRNLFYMMRFVELFPDEQIVNALRSQLSWTHFRELLSIENQLKRDFYAEMCRVERWSVRTLRHKIDHLLFERTAVAKKPEKLIEQDLAALRDQDRLTPDLVFRDPYLLDFLGLEEYEMPPGDELPLGLILCANGSPANRKTTRPSPNCQLPKNRPAPKRGSRRPLTSNRGIC